MPFGSRLLLRRLGPVGVALTVYDVWKHLSPAQRRRVASEVSRAARYLVNRGLTQINRRGR